MFIRRAFDKIADLMDRRQLLGIIGLSLCGIGTLGFFIIMIVSVLFSIDASERLAAYSATVLGVGIAVIVTDALR